MAREIQNETKNLQPIVVGLDIGTTKIGVIVGRKNEYGKIEIIGIGKTESVGVVRGVVVNIDKTVESIQRAIDEAQSKADVAIKYVNVGIAGQHIKSIQQKESIVRPNSEDTEISQKDVMDLIDRVSKIAVSPGEKIIDIIPQEYMVDQDSGIKDPVGMFGNRLEASFHIITGQVSAIRNLKRCVERASLEIKSLMLEPIASAAAVLSDEEKEAGVALVDIGGGTTDIAIFQDGIIRHTAVIPFGGNAITEDVKLGCSILSSQAEKLKVMYGSALARLNKDDEMVVIPGIRGREPKEISLKNLANIIEARMTEILKLVYYQIKNSGYEKRLIAGVVLTGGGAMLKDLKELAQYTLGMDVQIGYPNEYIAPTNNYDCSNPSFATGIGLVLKGFENENIQLTSPISSQTNISQETIREDIMADKEKKGFRSWLDIFIKSFRDEI